MKVDYIASDITYWLPTCSVNILRGGYYHLVLERPTAALAQLVRGHDVMLFSSALIEQ